tara:strand:+ start:2338 stop:3417 length:1080 start_codon:yes stop_codon:yes gene_type:complete
MGNLLLVTDPTDAIFAGVKVFRLNRWTLVIALIVVAACERIENSLQIQVRDYNERLMRVLDESVEQPAMSSAMPRLPRVRDLTMTLETGSVNPIEYLQLGDCELQNLIAKRNSSLGKLALPSQRLVYELKFLRLSGDCQAQLKDQELRAYLQQVTEKKRELLPSLIWQATLGSKEFRELWKYRSLSELPPLDPQLELALSRLNNDIDAWLAGDYRVDSARLEAQLSIIRWGNAGEHLSQWMVFNDELAMGTAILNSRLARRPLCFKDMKTKVADRFHAVVRQFLIGSIQPLVARLNRDHYSLFPLLRSLEGKLSIGEPSAYTAWREQRDLLLDRSVFALSRHVRSLEPLLKQCGYLPAG